MKNDNKFFNFIFKMIADIEELDKKIKNSNNDYEIEILEDEKITLFQELSNLIVGKLNQIWLNIEKMPDGEEKDYNIFMYDELLKDLDNILQGDEDYSEEE